ncbi:MAG: imidazoleglycerol-phosphate dehydratase HisB [Nitrososphaeria archaeon]
MRTASIERTTSETKVRVDLNLDGKGSCSIDTGVRFLDHMLTQLAVHSHMDLTVKAEGDLRHHVVEDVAIALGEAMKKGLGERKQIRRFGDAIVPMDDALAVVGLDLIQRPYADVELDLWSGKVEDMISEDISHFIETFVHSLQFTLHIWVVRGTNDHHKVEAVFKAFALSLRKAWAIDKEGRLVPSSKGKM